MKIRTIFKGALLILSLFGVLMCNVPSGEGTHVTALRCRDLVNPEGVDQAVLSWQLVSGKKNVTQTAWDIQIASTGKALRAGDADVWCSGKRESDQQIGIRPDSGLLQNGNGYWWRVRVWDQSGEPTPWSDPAYFSLGLSPQQWSAQWITAQREDASPLPCFRKSFDIEKNPVRGVVYLSGLGCSDLFVNGRRVDSTRILDPAQTNYEQYALYSTFDVTPLLKKGANCVGVMLGDGWYNQNRVWGKGFSYGQPILRLQMEIFYPDSSKQVVGTDQSWLWTSGPVVSSNLYAGEVFDARKRMVGWAESETPNANWQNAVPATGIIPAVLKPQLMEPIRMQKEITPVALWQDSAGNWIYDFGVNLAAIPCLRVKQPAGTRLMLRMGEILNDNRSIDFSTTGVIATGVVQTDEYICNGAGKETWTPRFTYHGFRYLELSGTASTPELSWITAIPVYTDVQQRGTFECSDPQINRLHELAVRTMLSNIHGLPTDCPHRERCGWLGDAHAVAPFESFNYNMNNFWMKYMEDISSSSSVFLPNTLHQKLHNSEFYFADKQPGIPFMISPGRRLCGVASPDWGTAVVQIPWHIYLYYGNPEALEHYYGEMKQWVDHIEALTENHIVPYGLGDWCPPGGNRAIDCPIPLSSSAFHYLDASIVAQAAAVLGKTEDAAHYNQLKDQIAAAFVDTFYDKEQKTFGSQTANAMALGYGLVPESDRKAVSDATVHNMEQNYNDFIHTGIFGLGHIGQALSRYGNAPAAWRVFTKTGENSFAWMWDKADATTLWETLPVNEVSTAVGRGSSLNHPMQGVYDAWFYEDIAGIRPDVSGPGFKVTRFAPTMTETLSWAQGSIESPYGKVASNWKRDEDKLQWTIEIPANTSGLVGLPDGKKISVEGVPLNLTSYPIAEQDNGVSFHRFPSGTYQIEIR